MKIVQSTITDYEDWVANNPNKKVIFVFPFGTEDDVLINYEDIYIPTKNYNSGSRVEAP